MRYIVIAIILAFAFALVSQSLGPFSHLLYRSLAFFSLLLIVLIGLKGGFLTFDFPHGVLLFLSLFLVLRGEGILGILGVGLFPFSFSSKKVSIFPLYLFSLFSSLFFSLLLISPLLFLLMRKISLFSSNLVGLSLGHTISTLPLLISFFFLLSLFIFDERKKRIYPFVFSGLSLVAAYFVYLIVLKTFPFFTESITSGKLIPLEILPFLLYSFSLLIFKKMGERSKNTEKVLFSYISLVLFLSGTLLFFYQKPPQKIKKSVYITNLGILDFELPRHGNYGARSAGKFGLLVNLLKSHGYEIKIGDLTDKLDGYPVLVFINMNQKLDDERREKVSQFIKRGGSLLVLADHTNIGNSGDAQNEVTEPLGGRIRFDSAKPFRYGWQSSLLIFHHPVTSLVKKETEIHHWIGASVDFKPPYSPILVGRYAFSDRGNRENPERAFLGNMFYDAGEEVGDLVLAGYKRVGKGKILLFGDTSSFQNPTLYSTYPFVLATFRWLCSGKGQTPLRESIALIMLILSLSLFPFSQRKRLFGILFILIFSFAFYLERGINKKWYKVPLKMEKIALLDFSHGERFDLMGWENESIGGLILNTMRDGYFPVILRGFDPNLLKKANCIFVISPTRNFRKGELDQLQNFLEKGGYLFLSVGWEEKEGSQNILKNFNLDMKNIPLGRTRVKINGDIVQIMEGWPVFDLDNSSETILKAFGYPVIIFKKVKKGGIFLIGDSKFFLNPNLEALEKFNIGNIIFLKSLLERREGVP